MILKQKSYFYLRSNSNNGIDRSRLKMILGREPKVSAKMGFTFQRKKIISYVYLKKEKTIIRFGQSAIFSYLCGVPPRRLRNWSKKKIVTFLIYERELIKTKKKGRKRSWEHIFSSCLPQKEKMLVSSKSLPSISKASSRARPNKQKQPGQLTQSPLIFWPWKQNKNLEFPPRKILFWGFQNKQSWIGDNSFLPYYVSFYLELSLMDFLCSRLINNPLLSRIRFCPFRNRMAHDGRISDSSETAKTVSRPISFE